MFKGGVPRMIRSSPQFVQLSLPSSFSRLELTVSSSFFRQPQIRCNAGRLRMAQSSLPCSSFLSLARSSSLPQHLSDSFLPSLFASCSTLTETPSHHHDLPSSPVPKISRESEPETPSKSFLVRPLSSSSQLISFLNSASELVPLPNQTPSRPTLCLLFSSSRPLALSSPELDPTKKKKKNDS